MFFCLKTTQLQNYTTPHHHPAKTLFTPPTWKRTCSTQHPTQHPTKHVSGVHSEAAQTNPLYHTIQNMPQMPKSWSPDGHLLANLNTHPPVVLKTSQARGMKSSPRVKSFPRPTLGTSSPESCDIKNKTKRNAGNPRDKHDGCLQVPGLHSESCGSTTLQSKGTPIRCLLVRYNLGGVHINGLVVRCFTLGFSGVVTFLGF